MDRSMGGLMERPMDKSMGGPWIRSRGTLRAIALWLGSLAGLLAPRALPALPPGFLLEEVATGLDQPVCLAFAPDGTLFVGERTTGTVRAITRDGLRSTPVLRVPVSHSGERGLLGLAVAPDHATTGHLYVFYSRRPTAQRIGRFTIRDFVAGDETVILDEIPGAPTHNGGGLHFGPDGHLYFSVGDTGVPERARDLNVLPGKLHRVAPDGSIPDDNPWPGRSAFCRGVRNVFGFDFWPGPDGAPSAPVVIYAAENGPTTDDEIHRVVAGSDLGWPLVTGANAAEGVSPPLTAWTPTTAPVGLACYAGDLFPLSYSTSIFFTEYNTGRIRRLELDPSGTRLISEEVFLEGDLGPLFALAVGPDGSLWFTTQRSVHRVGHTAPPQRFVRGNVDGHDGVNLADALTLLAYVLAQGPEPECLAAADVDADGVIGISDVTDLLAYVFGALPQLPPPFPYCGLDRTSPLGCQRFLPCR